MGLEDPKTGLKTLKTLTSPDIRTIENVADDATNEKPAVTGNCTLL